MGVFVFLPLVLPLSAWPVARLAETRLHPRTATRLLTAVAVVMAVCSALCLALLMVVGTAQLPGNPLPDGWSDPQVRAAVPYDEVAGRAAIPALAVVAAACARTLWRHRRVTRGARRALAGVPGRTVAVLPDTVPYAYALPGGRGRIVVSTALLAGLAPAERRALFAHERAHLAARHHRHLLAAQLAARANPFLRPLRTAVVYAAERWADEDAARAVGDRRTVARAIGKAALLSPRAPAPTLAALAVTGPVPRRVAALLAPAPVARTFPSAFTSVGLAAWAAAAGALVSAMSSANSAVTLFLILHAATPL
ncbi:M56 family metallopeptidase [Streptomyces sp. 5-8]|uniref:M56 family metallopeptidase n=1 Tax=Streptomyces musisoli TaxID=2802280 RepID=A0ABS1NUV3_9ACTN|nr:MULTISPECIES: M56 family metallopeptidase [Streptomyces]MBL1103872.1 M56 family metallopeptidase [Streptomyces musisoli]MBY8843913.1 M56 family metallopeptidase [Streptomyces sp. SP2-10]